MKKMNKKIAVLLSCFIVLVVTLVIILLSTANMRNYNRALELYQDKDYKSAQELFSKLENYEDSASLSKKCKFYIKINSYSKSKSFSDAVTYIQNNKSIFDNKDEYILIFDEYRYLLAKQQYDNKEYVKAYSNLVDNTYNKSSSLIKKIEPLYKSEKAVDEILDEYQGMSDYLDNLLDGKSYAEQSLLFSTGVDWDMFYKNRGSAISNLQEDLKTNTINDCKSDIEDIIGYVPKTKQKCKKILSNLKKVFITDGGFKEYNGYFLYFVMSYITDADKYVETTRDETTATITIKQVDKYLKDNNMSSKTFAYMLGIPTMYEMDIEKLNDCLILSFSKSSHNYAYCSKAENDNRNFEKLEKGLERIINESLDKSKYIYTEDNYDYYELDLSGINNFNLDILRLTYISSKTDSDNQILSQDHHFLEYKDLLKDNLKLTIRFHKESEYIGLYYVGDFR